MIIYQSIQPMTSNLYGYTPRFIQRFVVSEFKCQSCAPIKRCHGNTAGVRTGDDGAIATRYAHLCRDIAIGLLIDPPAIYEYHLEFMKWIHVTIKVTITYSNDWILWILCNVLYRIWTILYALCLILFWLHLKKEGIHKSSSHSSSVLESGYLDSFRCPSDYLYWQKLWVELWRPSACSYICSDQFGSIPVPSLSAKEKYMEKSVMKIHSLGMFTLHKRRL